MSLDPTDSKTTAFLGLRLRALEQIVGAQGRDLLRAFDIQTPNICVSLLRFIRLNEHVTVTEIVNGLGVSRQVVLQRLKLLEDRGLIASGTDADDRRSRLIELTRAGAKEERLLRDLLARIESAFEELDRELGANLSALLHAAAGQLRTRSLIERVLEQDAKIARRQRRAARG